MINTNSLYNSQKKYNQLRHLYRLFKEDKNLLTIGVQNDVKYNLFFNKIKQSNIGAIDKIKESIGNYKIPQLESRVNKFAPKNFAEQNSKAVFEVYLRSYAKGIYQFNLADSLLLHNIALMDVDPAGDEVFMAQAMLKMVVLPNTFSISPKFGKNTNYQMECKVYPNPAENMVSFEFNNEIEQAILQIYDISGKLLISEFVDQTTKFDIDVSILTTGIYLYKVRSNNNQANGKLLIK